MPKKKSDTCEIFCFDEKKVKTVKKAIPSDKKIIRLSEFFKILSDKTRIKILLALENGELCVCDLAQILGLSISAVSHQLRFLRNAGTVKYRNEGKLVFYTLDGEHIPEILKDGMSIIK